MLYAGAVASLAFVALVLVIAKLQADQMRDELRGERARRLEAETVARQKTGQMDGALEKIQELSDRVDQLRAET